MPKEIGGLLIVKAGEIQELHGNSIPAAIANTPLFPDDCPYCLTSQEQLKNCFVGRWGLFYN